MPSDLRSFGGGSDAVVGDTVEKAGLSCPAADEIFYLGNDWKKDVVPATAVGFRTGLFAGDVRSLRLGGVGEEEVPKIRRVKVGVCRALQAPDRGTCAVKILVRMGRLRQFCAHRSSPS